MLCSVLTLTREVGVNYPRWCTRNLSQRLVVTWDSTAAEWPVVVPDTSGTCSRHAGGQGFEVAVEMIREHVLVGVGMRFQDVSNSGSEARFDQR